MGNILNYEDEKNKLKKAKRRLKVKKLIPYILSLEISFFGSKLFTGGYPIITDQKEAFAYYNITVDEDGKVFKNKIDYVTTEKDLPEAKISKKDFLADLEKITEYIDPKLTAFDFQKAISEGKLEELFDTFTIKDIYNDTMLLEKSAYPNYEINLYEINKKDTKFVDEPLEDNLISTLLFTILLMSGLTISTVLTILQDYKYQKDKQEKRIIRRIKKKLY